MWHCQPCMECLTLLSNGLHPRPGPWGGTAEYPNLCIFLLQGPGPIHLMGAIPILIQSTSNTCSIFHWEIQELWPPPPTNLLSPVQRQWPQHHSLCLWPLVLHANAQPDAAFCVYGRKHWLHQDKFFKKISHRLYAQLFIEITKKRALLTHFGDATFYAMRKLSPSALTPPLCLDHQRASLFLLKHYFLLVLAPPQPP